MQQHTDRTRAATPPSCQAEERSSTAWRSPTSSARNSSHGNTAGASLARGRVGSGMTPTPHSRNVATLRTNTGCRASATLGQAPPPWADPRPIPSLSRPSASVSLIPQRHPPVGEAASGQARHAANKRPPAAERRMRLPLPARTLALLSHPVRCLITPEPLAAGIWAPARWHGSSHSQTTPTVVWER